MQHFSQNHIDEFSVSDIRHTLREVLRVVRARRWLFIVPTLVLMTLAFVGSLFIPRNYEGAALIKSEHDPVFSIVSESVWSKPFAEIKDRMLNEIKDKKLIEEVLVEKGVFDGFPRHEDGSLTAASLERKERILNDVVGNLTSKVANETDNTRVTKISLRHADRNLIPLVLEGLRERYLPRATAMATEVLEDVHAFLKAEADRSREKIASLEQRLLEFEVKYPGINPEAPDRTQSEESKLIFEKIDVERELSEMRTSKADLQRTAAFASAAKNAPGGGMAMRQVTNPRYTELAEDIKRINEEIHQGLTIKEMTEAHPAIVRLREILEVRRTELANTSTTIAITAVPEEVASAQQVANLTEDEMAKTESRIASGEHRLAAINARLDEIDRGRALAMEHRHAYHKTKAELTRLSKELHDWQEHIAPVSQVLYLENMNRAVRFDALQDAWVTRTPVTPKVSLVILVCVGLGLAVGVLSVLVAELLDHSYRTAKQLTTSLGIPVIESVDEIMTAAASKRRLLRRLVVMPAFGLFLFASAITAGLVAYGSLHNPENYKDLTEKTRDVYERIVGIEETME